MFFNKPIFFDENRVFRVYTGGKLLGDLHGKEYEDDYYPEEWIASAVRAMNEGSTDEYEGISKIQCEDLYFNDALKKFPNELTGGKNELDILVKYIDSAVRLPIQAHPTRDFSKQYFSSEHGKEECWYILDTRPGACVYFGFKEGVSKENFIDAIEKSETDKCIMENLLVRHEVKKGDVIYIPAKAVHAIGAGCLILEVQEPTDFTIQPERWCAEYKLSDYQMYLGLDKSTALECFDFESGYDTFVTPTVIRNDGKVVYESFINDSITKSFSLSKVSISDSIYTLDENVAIYIVTSGSGVIVADNYEKKISCGDYFFLPAAAHGFKIESDNIEILICK